MKNKIKKMCFLIFGVTFLDVSCSNLEKSAEPKDTLPSFSSTLSGKTELKKIDKKAVLPKFLESNKFVFNNIDDCEIHCQKDGKIYISLNDTNGNTNPYKTKEIGYIDCSNLSYYKINLNNFKGRIFDYRVLSDGTIITSEISKVEGSDFYFQEICKYRNNNRDVLLTSNLFDVQDGAIFGNIDDKLMFMLRNVESKDKNASILDKFFYYKDDKADVVKEYKVNLSGNSQSETSNNEYIAWNEIFTYKNLFYINLRSVDNKKCKLMIFDTDSNKASEISLNNVFNSVYYIGENIVFNDQKQDNTLIKHSIKDNLDEKVDENVKYNLLSGYSYDDSVLYLIQNKEKGKPNKKLLVTYDLKTDTNFKTDIDTSFATESLYNFVTFNFKDKVFVIGAGNKSIYIWKYTKNN